VKHEEEYIPGDTPLEPHVPTLEDLVKKEVRKLVESGMVIPTPISRKKEGSVKMHKKVLPKVKKKVKNKGKNNWKEFMSQPILENSLMVDHNVMTMPEQKRSRVESNLKYPP
jgi:hypothetical protein